MATIPTTALMKKVACNATNSAALDDLGNLYVWGSTKYGLCGEQQESAKSKASSGKGGPPKAVALAEPRKLALLPEEVRDAHKEGETCSVFHLLDPDPSKRDQVYCAQHISFGAYHAGVVCDDVSTSYPFEPVPPAQLALLHELRDHLLKIWQELERQRHAEIQSIRRQWAEKVAALAEAVESGTARKGGLIKNPAKKPDNAGNLWG